MTDLSDSTFRAVSKYGSSKWVAATLGVSLDKFRRILPKMQNDGFPCPDPIVGLYIKADVQTWIDQRRQCVKSVNIAESQTLSGANLDAV